MIVSSRLVLVSPQADGRVYAIEEHITDQGVVLRVEGLRDSVGSLAKDLVARVPVLEQQEADRAQAAIDILSLEAADAKLRQALLSNDKAMLSEAKLSSDEIEAWARINGN